MRECLNYGHTLGHAIEACTGYGTFSHGAAVAEGMRFAARLAIGKLGASEEFAQAQADLLDTLGLPLLVYEATPQDLLSAMKRDKKSRGGEIRFVLARDIAAWEIVAVNDEAILEALQ